MLYILSEIRHIIIDSVSWSDAV